MLLAAYLEMFHGSIMHGCIFGSEFSFIMVPYAVVYFIGLDILTDMVHSDKCPFFKMKNSDIYTRTNIPLSSTKNNKEHSGSVIECLTRAREVRASPTSLVTALWSLSKTHLSYLSTGSTQEDPSLFN